MEAHMAVMRKHQFTAGTSNWGFAMLRELAARDEPVQAEKPRPYDSTGAMAAAWFGTDADGAVERIFPAGGTT